MTSPIITPGKSFIFQGGASYTDYSSQIDSVSLNRANDLLEAVTGGGRSFAVGYENSTIDIGGPWEPTIDGQINTLYASKTAQNWRLYPAGTGAGMPYYYGTALFTDYNLSIDAAQQTKWTGKMTVLSATRATV